MELTNYSDLQNEDILNIRRLLNPNFDTSEVDRFAAERSLGGGAFSGARRNRLLESERNARALQGHSMLTPYLQRASAVQMQTQAEQAAAQRQLEQNNAEMQRLQLSLQNANERQAQDIQARMRELNAQNQAAMERLQVSEQGSTARTMLGEQGASARQATGIQAELERARMAADSAYRLQENSLAAQRGIAEGGWQNSQTLAEIGNRGAMERAQLGQGDDSATMAAINDILSQMGGGVGGGTGRGGGATTNRRNVVGTSGYFTGGAANGSPIGTGNFDSEGIGNFDTQPIWQTGSNPDEINWGSVDSQINNPNSWIDSTNNGSAWYDNADYYA